MGDEEELEFISWYFSLQISWDYSSMQKNLSVTLYHSVLG